MITESDTQQLLNDRLRLMNLSPSEEILVRGAANVFLAAVEADVNALADHIFGTPETSK